GIKHVLLISIDGMHAVDFINCAQGVDGVNGGIPYCPNLAQLAKTGVNYLETSTSKPSDSFPGLMALVSGGSPRTVGAFYDVAYDRVLAPPAQTTGNGLAAGPCIPFQPNGTTTEYEEGIDKDQSKLNGGAPDGLDGGIASIDPKRLIRDPFNGCKPVYPWNFVRTNTIFGVVHQAGGYTAWSDKHPSYSSVAGPGDGSNVNDYYSPEINSNVVPLPGVPAVPLPGLTSCDPIPDPTNTGSWTDSFDNIKCYDSLKVQAILNEINGWDHTGKKRRPVPSLFGMNFQVVSVGQKLIEKSIGMKGGYLDNEGRPTDELLGEIQFADAAIGQMVGGLQNRGLYQSTLIVISAKHGQSPIDSQRYLGIGVPSGSPITTSPAMILDALLPLSERPSNSPPGIGPTEDDISLLWLADASKTTSAVQTLESTSPATSNVAGIGEIFSGPGIAQMFNPPGLPPYGDPRTPDIIVQPNIGVTYSGSTKKLAEHGGFSHDDTNVVMLVSNPGFSPATVTSPVATVQIAPTILAELGLDPQQLEAVQKEGNQVLPGLGLGGQ
ncbi:MAG: alkaline phosphatase family protein, partial [Mycobacterium sp.]|nr:alkaline phosphatase family protein [Mycobacterium sp.]